MDGRTDRWMDRWMDGRTDGRMDGRTRTDGRTDGQTDGRTDGLTDGRLVRPGTPATSPRNTFFQRFGTILELFFEEEVKQTFAQKSFLEIFLKHHNFTVTGHFPAILLGGSRPAAVMIPWGA